MKQIKPMGCKAIKKEKIEEILNDSNYVAEKKYDGSRYVIQITLEGIFLTSRRESTKGGMVDKTDNIPHIINELKQLKMGVVLDGEIDIQGEKRNFRHVQRVMGSSCEKSIKLQDEEGRVIYKVFDILEYENKDLRNESLKNRRKILDTLFTNLNLTYVKLVEQYKDKEKKELFKIEIDKGQEGIMLKNINSKYIEDAKPSKTWYKMKKTYTYDGIVKGYKLGSGKYQFTIGTLEVYQYIKDELKLTANVAGLSEEKREYFKKHLDNGKSFIIEFECQETIPKNHKYRFPHFLRIREDKNEKECIYGKA